MFLSGLFGRSGEKLGHRGTVQEGKHALLEEKVFIVVNGLVELHCLLENGSEFRNRKKSTA